MFVQPQRKASALIIGGGIVGAALFQELCSFFNGNVVLLEKTRFARGATGWSAGIVRGYHSDNTLLGRGPDCCDFYRQLSAKEPALHFEKTGMFYFEQPEQRDNTAARVASPFANRLNVKWHSAADKTENRLTDIRWQGVEGVVFEPECGYFDPHAVTEALIKGGRSRGGYALEGVSALHPIAQDDRIVGMETNVGIFEAPFIILCAGAWSEKISKQWNLGLPIESRAIQMNHYKVPRSSVLHPVFIDDVLGLYGRGNGQESIFMGIPVGKPCHDPDISEPLDALHAETTLKTAKNRFAWADCAVWEGGLRAYDGYTEDRLGLIQPHAGLRGLIVASGFSGGGFKQAPAVAKKVLELIKGF